MVVDVRDVIAWFKFGDDRLRGLGSAEGQSLPFPVDFDGRPYNTLTLPCDYNFTLLRSQVGRILLTACSGRKSNRCSITYLNTITTASPLSNRVFINRAASHTQGNELSSVSRHVINHYIKPSRLVLALGLKAQAVLHAGKRRNSLNGKTQLDLV